MSSKPAFCPCLPIHRTNSKTGSASGRCFTHRGSAATPAERRGFGSTALRLIVTARVGGPGHPAELVDEDAEDLINLVERSIFAINLDGFVSPLQMDQIVS